jgi:hypothetical protein
VDDHPGVIALTTGTTDNDNRTISNMGIAFEDIVGNNWDLSLIVRPTSAVTDTALWIGLSTHGTISSATSAIVARYDTDKSDTTWIFVVCNAVGAAGCNATTDDTNIQAAPSTKVPTLNTWQRIEIRRRTSGVGGNPTIYFSVNDETDVTFCSSGCTETIDTAPTTGLSQLYIVTVARAASTAKTLQVDYAAMTISVSGARYTP